MQSGTFDRPKLPSDAPRTDSFSTDVDSRSASIFGQQSEMMAAGPPLRGSISAKPDLTIDIPVDKRADRNPSFKTPNQHQQPANPVFNQATMMAATAGLQMVAEN